MKICDLHYGKVSQAMNKTSRRGVKCFTFMMLLLSFTLGVKANPVDMRLAREVGAKFINANTTTKVASSSDLQWVTTYRTTDNVAAFYVFNASKGYVIVAADDFATPILGYSIDGQFDPNNLPDAMQEYLMGFVDQIQYGIDYRLQADEQTARQWELVRSEGKLNSEKGNRSVSPMLTSEWGQGSNGYMYNMYCPDDPNGPNGHAITGCTATAMAQIMRYWGYPAQGVGSNSYTPDGYPQQTVNFGATTYDWTNMPDALSPSSSNAQNQAVATLMWHCGVALEVDYGPYGTNGYESAVVTALTTYFDYSSDASFLWREDFSDANWLTMIKNDLDLGRPIHYRGANSENGDGHMFVLDGYDANDLIHINWGWYGSYNDYFALSSFIPESGYDFSYYHCAVFNIHPNCSSSTTFQVTATASPSYGGMVSGAGSYSCGSDCTLTATPYNGYHFVNWTQNGMVISSSAVYSFEVNANVDLVANFSDGLVVGDGSTITNNYLPSYSYFCYSLTQQIYTASELGESGNITSIAFYNGGAEKTRTYDFYLKTTAKSSFSSNTDWETVSASDLVFSGSVTMAAGGWTVLTLDTPFAYDGMSNVVLVTDDNTGSWTGSPHMSCRVYDASSQSIRIYSDGTDYDPYAPASYNGTLLSVKNQLLITKDMPAPTLQVFAEYYPDANSPQSPYVKVSWGTELTSIEDFEHGDFSLFDWQLDPTYPWEITTTNPYEGNYCMMSGNYNIANSTSTMEAKVRVPDNGQISFFSKISSEQGWDHGYFYIDDVQIASYSGDGSWGEKTFDVTSGVHTFRWTYTKDGSVNSYDDCFYVDYITFYQALEPVQSGWHTYLGSEFDEAYRSNVGDPSWGYEYPISIMSRYVGFNLTKVAVFSDDMYNAVGGNFTCNVYVGGSTPGAGTLASTVTVDVPVGQGAWCEYDLPTSVYVTGSDPIWVIWHVNTYVGSYPAGCASHSSTYGDWWDNGQDGWQHMEGVTWTMKNYFTNAKGSTVVMADPESDPVVVNSPFNISSGIRTFVKGQEDNTAECINPNAVKGVSIAMKNARSLSNYRVYRANCDGSGIQMIADNVTQNYYIDTDWAALAMGNYKYGVSTFSVGRESAISWVETENGNIQPLTMAEAEAMGIELSPTAAQAPMDGNPSGYRAAWNLLGSYNCASAYQYGVATDGQYIYHSAWSSSAGFMFAKYDMQGNFIETFDVAGCGYLRDLTYDGQYFYGGAAGSVLYCVDLTNQTLISTTTTSCSAIRCCAYDPVRDGFWVGNWSNAIQFIDRSGNNLITGPDGVSFSGAAYYMDENHVEHVYFYAQPYSSSAMVYDYDIASNTMSSSYIFNVTGDLEGASGTSGGCFIGEYMGKMAFFADVQQEPNLVGIFELKNASAWSNCIDKLYVAQAIELTQGWNWWSTYLDITLNDLKAALVAAMPGATNIVIKSQSNGQTTYNGNTWRGQLTTLDVTQMYRIKVQTSAELTLTGAPINPAEHPVTITSGTNWIGFPLSENKTLGNAFAGFAVSGDVVKSQSGLSTFNGTIWRGGFSSLEPGKGYIYKSNVQSVRTFTFGTSK